MPDLHLPVSAPTAELFRVFAGLSHDAHIDSFWVGICLKTKPPVGVPSSETFVDDVDAEPNDWLVSIRVTGLQDELSRVVAIEPLVKHFRMYLDEELKSVGSSLDAAFGDRKFVDDQENQSDPHSGSYIYTLATRGDDAAISMEKLVWKERQDDAEVEVSRDAKERMVVGFARGFRSHLDHAGDRIVKLWKDKPFLVDDDIMYGPTGVAWMKLTYAKPAEVVTRE